jgi:RimJ/RimL family protein N-acetyltransferase
MICRLEKVKYDKVLPLFTRFPDHPVIRGVIEGNNPGIIWVDDRAYPQRTLLWAMFEQDFFLAGDASNVEFNFSLNKWIFEEVMKEAQANNERSFCLILCNREWEEKVSAILSGKEYMIDYTSCFRLNYEKFSKHFNWREKVAADLVMREVDKELFLRIKDDSGIPFRNWWYSYRDFESKGLGFTLMMDDILLSTCFACFVGANAVEIGIVTDPDYQRKGYATLTAAAFIEKCLEKGLDPIWHTGKNNVPSNRLALKLGFEKTGELKKYCFMYDDFENLYEIAYNATYSLKDFEKAISTYKLALEKGEPTAGFYYHYAVALNKIGKRDEAFSKLYLALSTKL